MRPSFIHLVVYYRSFSVVRDPAQSPGESTKPRTTSSWTETGFRAIEFVLITMNKLCIMQLLERILLRGTLRPRACWVVRLVQVGMLQLNASHRLFENNEVHRIDDEGPANCRAHSPKAPTRTIILAHLARHG